MHIYTVRYTILQYGVDGRICGNTIMLQAVRIPIWNQPCSLGVSKKVFLILLFRTMTPNQRNLWQTTSWELFTKLAILALLTCPRRSSPLHFLEKKLRWYGRPYQSKVVWVHDRWARNRSLWLSLSIGDWKCRSLWLRLTIGDWKCRSLWLRLVIADWE